MSSEKDGKASSLVSDTIEGYFVTSDRPVDNKTGAIDAVGDVQSAKHAALEAVTKSSLSKMNVVSDVAVGVVL